MKLKQWWRDLLATEGELVRLIVVLLIIYIAIWVLYFLGIIRNPYTGS